MMASILKILSLVATIVSTLLLTVEGIRRGLIIVSTIFGLIKLLVILLFLGLAALTLYLVLRPAPEASSE